MTIKDLIKNTDWKILTGENGLDREVTGMYVCDLLSWVMSHADKGNVWVTVLTHLNTVAVAVLTEVACILIPENITVEAATLEKAEQEGVVILSTGLGAYEICCRAHQLGI